jgi:hypothetical protein
VPTVDDTDFRLIFAQFEADHAMESVSLVGEETRGYASA